MLLAALHHAGARHRPAQPDLRHSAREAMGNPRKFAKYLKKFEVVILASDFRKECYGPNWIQLCEVACCTKARLLPCWGRWLLVAHN
jgi:hypothetical protein